MTLLAGGAAGAHRTWASTYIGVGLLPAARLLVRTGQRRQWLKRTAGAAGAVTLVVLLIGNISSGEPVDYRFPGPYEFASDTSSVTPETLRLAHWVKTHLGPSPHIVTDRFTALALSGRADALTPLQTGPYPFQESWYNRLRRNRRCCPPCSSRETTTWPSICAIPRTVPRQAEAPLFVQGEPNIVPGRDMTRLGHWPWLRLLYSSQNYRLYRINFVLYYLGIRPMRTASDVQQAWRDRLWAARDLGLLALGAILLFLCPAVPGLSRIVVLPALLLAPGFAFLRLLGQRPGWRSISVAVPASIALIVCAVLLLDVSGLRLDPLSLGLTLGSFTVLFLVGSYARRR